MAYRISRAVLGAILDDARSTPDRERCGLLLGSGGDISGSIAAANVHPDPERHFELDPAVLLSAERSAREAGAGGTKLLGHYHSHPMGAAVPSATDAAMAAADGRLWMIINADEVTLWRSPIDQPAGTFWPEDLIIVDG